MSEINVTTIKNENADYGPNLVGYSTVTGDLRVTGTIFGDLTGDVTGNADTATDATNAQVDNDFTTNATRYITFADAGGGVQRRIKVDSDLTYNPSTGELTATSFSGDGQNLTNTGSTLSEPSTGTQRIVTTSLTSGTMTSSGTGAELAFDYANNHLEFSDNTEANFGTGNDLRIFHDGTHSYIISQTGTLYLRGNGGFEMMDTGGNETYFKAVDNGTVELYYDNVKKLETTTTGVTVTGDVNSTSDINLKKDIEVVTSATEMLNELRGVRFIWKENGEPSLGVIAQEVEAILPELVRGEEGDKSVNYSGLIGVLIEAVKELSARVEELEKEH